MKFYIVNGLLPNGSTISASFEDEVSAKDLASSISSSEVVEAVSMLNLHDVAKPVWLARIDIISGETSRWIPHDFEDDQPTFWSTSGLNDSTYSHPMVFADTKTGCIFSHYYAGSHLSLVHAVELVEEGRNFVLQHIDITKLHATSVEGLLTYSDTVPQILFGN